MNIKDILKRPIHPLFNISYHNGKYRTTNKSSFYQKNVTPERLTYDVSNQKVVGNVSFDGTVEELSFCQDNFLTEEKPGVWVNKHFIQTENLQIHLTIDHQSIDLNKKDHDISIDVINDSLPRIVHRYESFSIYMFPFCPIVAGKRYSMLVYKLFIENHSQRTLQLDLPVVPLYQKKYSDQQNVLIHVKGEVTCISPENIHGFSVGFIDPNAYNETQNFYTEDMDEWLKETLCYYQNIYGKLSLPDKNVTHLLNRAIYQSFTSFGMNKTGDVVGSNWGSYPITNRIWNKDMYYTSFPFLLFEPELCRKTILWFTKYGVKFPGTKFSGGVNHSLSNSLSSTILSGLYYEYTGDDSFFAEYPEVLENSEKIIHALLEQHKEEPLLFTSTWISDAFALGKYHTGSNICFWKACQGLSTIYRGLEEKDQADFYEDIAVKSKQAILENMTIEGSFGEQFLEGIGDEKKDLYSVKHYQKPIIEQGMIFLSDSIKDGQIQLQMHDGEESDTTVLPFYRFLDKRDLRYHSTMKFSASEENPTYNSEIKGIMWGLESGATFPGFITVLMSALNDEDRFQQQLHELLQLADLDGSWWWWPYPLNPTHGEVVRNFGIGKCGWASGIFVSLFVTQYLGITKEIDKVIIDPITSNEFSWENLKLGDAKLSVWQKDKCITVRNLREKPQIFEFYLENETDARKGKIIQRNGKKYLQIVLDKDEQFCIERSLS